MNRATSGSSFFFEQFAKSPGHWLNKPLGRLFLNEVRLNRKFFIAGFVVGLLAFVAANAYAYHLAIPPCCDATIDFGVPFALGNYGGFFGGTRFLIGGLFIDGVLAVVASAFFSWLFAIMVPRIIRLVRYARGWHLRTRS